MGVWRSARSAISGWQETNNLASACRRPLNIPNKAAQMRIVFGAPDTRRGGLEGGGDGRTKILYCLRKEHRGV